MIKLIQTTLLTTAIVSVISPLAQADNQGRRYSVEMIVFSYEKTDTEQSEKWPEETQVELPDKYLVLYPDSAVNSMAARLRNANKIRLAAPSNNAESPTLDVKGTPIADENNLDLAQLNDLQQGLWPDRFLYNPGRFQLTSQQRKLSRRNDFRILYHQAWHMPMNEKTESLPIRIQGGEQYDGFYELDGTIQLSVARYLHIETQLYLSEFEPIQTERQTSLPAYTESASSLNLSNGNIAPSIALSSLGVRQFQTKQVIALKQSRKMRSGELHYIDNPRYGILIQMTPYKITEKLN
ncbi:CsiV family protein [Oceanospirillum multiglobuliferum]|nr:CsiV family protein [Oceanospirillum multiglobuliferum]